MDKKTASKMTPDELEKAVKKKEEAAKKTTKKYTAKKETATKEKPKKSKTTDFKGMAIIDGRMVGLTWEEEKDRTLTGLNVPRKFISKDRVFVYNKHIMDEYNRRQEEIYDLQNKQLKLLANAERKFMD